MSSKASVCSHAKTCMERNSLTSHWDGLNISFAVTRPVGEPVAVLQLVHGMCGCKERFEQFMEYMAAGGVVCVVSDLRGHGDSVWSPEDRGYMYKGGYKALLSDIRQVSDWILAEFPGLPYYLIGHSMGSLAARLCVKEDDSHLSGLVICGSPSWNPLTVFGKWMTGLCCALGLGRRRPEFLQKITSDRYNRRFASEGPQSWTCSDPLSRKQFRENPRCNFRFTLNGTYNLLCMMGQTYSSSPWKVSVPQLPVLFLAGADDPCIISETKFNQAVNRMRQAGYRNVHSRLYPGMRHEILNETDKITVWNDILDFIKGRKFWQ